MHDIFNLHFRNTFGFREHVWLWSKEENLGKCSSQRRRVPQTNDRAAVLYWMVICTHARIKVTLVPGSTLTYTCTHTQRLNSTHPLTCTDTHTHTHTHTHTQPHACTQTHIHARTHTDSHIHTYIHVHTQTHTYMHVHTQTHTHT